LPGARQSEELHACAKAVGHVAVNFDRNFPVPPLRFHHAGERNELSFCRIANGTSLTRTGVGF
jgi:hypothetical protein